MVERFTSAIHLASRADISATVFTNRSGGLPLANVHTKHVRTVADLVRFKRSLKVERDRCGNSRTLSGFDVVKLCGSQDLRQVQDRLKCSLCGARGAKLTVLSPPAPRD